MSNMFSCFDVRRSIVACLAGMGMLVPFSPVNAEENVDPHGVYSGVDVVPSYGPTPSQALRAGNRWIVHFNIEPDYVTNPRDPETIQADSGFKHVRFLVSCRDNDGTPNADGRISSLAIVWTDGTAKAFRVDMAPPGAWQSVPAGIGHDMQIRWISGNVVEITQKIPEKLLPSLAVKKVIMVCDFNATADPNGIKRFECRAGINLKEAVDSRPLPQNPIIRVDVTPSPRDNTKTITKEVPIWGGWSIANGQQLVVESNTHLLPQWQAANPLAIHAGDYIAILPTPAMPTMKAYVIPSVNENFKWDFTITCSRCPTGEEPTDVIIPPETPLSGISHVMLTEYMSGEFRGGTAYLHVTKEATAAHPSFDKEFTFYIRGLNPDRNVVKSYLRGLQGGNQWYVCPIAYRESHYLQFNEGEKDSIGPDEELNVKDLPNRSNDGYNGYGVMQLTDDQPTKQQIWNWQENCAEGVLRLTQHRADATTWLRKQRKKARGMPVPDYNIMYNDSTHNTITQVGTLKDVQQSSPQNAQNRIVNVLDALTIQRYNGAWIVKWVAKNTTRKIPAHWEFNEPRGYIGEVLHDMGGS